MIPSKWHEMACTSRTVRSRPDLDTWPYATHANPSVVGSPGVPRSHAPRDNRVSRETHCPDRVQAHARHWQIQRSPRLEPAVTSNEWLVRFSSHESKARKTHGRSWAAGRHLKSAIERPVSGGRLTLKSQKVLITDLNSMHGTSLNGEKIGSLEPRPLTQGDKLVFGISVYRNQQTFQPTEVKVGIEFHKA